MAHQKFWQNFMAHQYMPKIFHDPDKNPPALPSPYLRYEVLSALRTAYYLLLKKVMYHRQIIQGLRLNFQVSHLCILGKVVVQELNLKGLFLQHSSTLYVDH